MKKILFSLLVVFSCLNVYSQENKVLKNGMYEATVVVKDSSQPTSKARILNVYVIDDRVVQVKLKSGEIISEKSPNVSSYRFGELSFSESNSKLKGTALIKVLKKNGDNLKINVEIEIPAN